MKRLRNTAIYYIFFGVLLAVSFIFSLLWGFSIIGIFLLFIYLFLKYILKVEKFPNPLSKRQTKFLNFFLIIFPFLIVAIIYLSISKPYKQKIILPSDYEGIVVIEYNQENGSAKEWSKNSLGFNSYRIIRVDTTGIGRTQFKFYNKIPLLALKMKQYPEIKPINTLIAFENNPKKDILRNSEFIPPLSFIAKETESPSIYVVPGIGSSNEVIAFVVTDSKNYYRFFEDQPYRNHNKKGDQKKSNKLKKKYLDKLKHKGI